MREWLFRLGVLTLGLTLLGTLVYGLAGFPLQTITQTMIDSAVFRIFLTVCVILQVIVWFLCVWSKRHAEPETANWAFVALSVVVISWIALSTILTNTTHDLFVGICVGALLVFLLLITKMTSHRDSVMVLHFSILILIASIIAMIILYNTHHFFIPEYVIFITYSLIFTAFFSIHTNTRWVEEDNTDACCLRELDWDNESDVPCEHSIPLIYPTNERGIFHVGRCGAVWVPQRI
jgi:uncharacterized membrane protein